MVNFIHSNNASDSAKSGVSSLHDIPALNSSTYTKVMNYDLSQIISQSLKKNLIPSENINAVERDYRHFMYLCAVSDDQIAVPSVEVDTLWHFHIIHTKHYREFCQAFAGKFIDHFPNDESEDEVTDRNYRTQLRSRLRLISEKQFGCMIFSNLPGSFNGCCYGSCSDSPM